MPLLEVQHVQKIYTTRFGGTQVQALSNVSFSVEEGEYVAIMGESGSGKTTLLNILAALDRPTAGEVLLEGRPLSAIRERDLAAFRRSHLGFVFQDFNLLDTFSLQDNIYLPLVLAGTDYREMQQKLRPIADQLGISDILAKYPYEVSGGQKQRAAVARALITDPELVLADEDRLESVIKEIYFVTAQHFGCHWTSVERNIRTIVQRAWRVNPTLLGKMAGYPLTDVPTVSEFLEIISAHILRLALKSR